MKVSVILPSTGRAKQLVKCVEQFYKVSPSIELICVIVQDSESMILLRDSGLPVHMLFRTDQKGPIYRWNEGAVAATGDAFVLAADDQWPHERWLEEAMIAMDGLGGSGLVGINDGYQKNKRYAGSYLVTRDYCKSAFGGVLCCPHYKHYSADLEACEIATRDNRYIFAEKSVLEHRHRYRGKAEYDTTYHMGDAYHEIDGDIYNQRKAKRFPIDWEPLF